MTSPQPCPIVHITPEALADAHQLRELLIGVVALLQHPHRAAAIEAARGAALEARAVAERVAAHLDALAVVAHEAERAAQAKEGR